MIAIIDYGAGNPVSVKKALDWLGQESLITNDRARIRRAAKIILPGVGHFSSTRALNESGAQDAIEESLTRGTPFLGICLGMHWMLEGSEEAPGAKGSGILAGNCARFPNTVKLPHVGWNHLKIHPESRLLRGLEQSSLVYFTHSYFVPVVESTVACCEYGIKFSAAVERDHVFGVQFHPEKSGDVGLRLLSNFCSL